MLAMLKPVVLGFLAMLVLAGNVRAESVYLDYSVTRGCPARHEFEQQVHARTPLAHFVYAPHSGRFFRVHAGVEGALVKGWVTSGRGNQVGSAREVSSQGCDDVVAALALIVALAIDPHAFVAPLSPPTARFPSESATSRPASLAPATVVPLPLPNGGAAASTPPSGPGHPGSRSSSSIALEVGSALGGSAWLTSPVALLGAWGLTLVGEDTRSALDAAAIQLTLAYAKSQIVHTTNSAGARFEIWSAELAYCPLRIQLSSEVLLRPCGALAGGRLTGFGLAGASLDYESTSHRRWGLVSELAQVRFRVRNGWQLFSDVGIGEPLWHYRFVFLTTPRTTIAKVPVLVPRLNLGLTWLFL